MKELSIEEKAKHYDEAVEYGQYLINERCKEGTDGSFHRSDLERMFPELAESNDVRIRNKIIATIHLYYEEPLEDEAKEMIAWVEKQGEDKKEDYNILQRFSFYTYKDEPNILYLSGLYVNEECRNKGIGTKILEITDEVAKNLNCPTIRLKTKKDSNAEKLYRKHGYNSLAIEESNEIWLEKQGEQKLAGWSKEDKDYYDAIIAKLEVTQEEALLTDNQLNFLKSLKGKIQLKQEWSEEDESMRTRCIGALMKCYMGELPQTVIDEVEWLKSLRPQSTWKPSEEQMEGIECTIKTLKYQLNCGDNRLDSLYNDLKKLKDK